MQVDNPIIIESESGVTVDGWLIHKTQKAILVQTYLHGQLWIPKSAILAYDEELGITRLQTYFIIVEDWVLQSLSVYN